MRAIAQEDWAPGPPTPLLADGAVHVWRADLTAVAGGVRELLNDAEHARAQRIVNPRKGELWELSRGVLRDLLGRYLHRDPGSLRFVIGEHGKPELVPDGDPSRVSFNMSHSGQLALYAFSISGKVGIDVEVPRRAIDEVAIAARTLGMREAQRLEDLDPAIRRREFLRGWARHEAELKCLGVGLAGTDGGARTATLWVEDLELGAGVGAAVAAAHPVRELRRWDWQAGA